MHVNAIFTLCGFQRSRHLRAEVECGASDYGSFQQIHPSVFDFFWQLKGKLPYGIIGRADSAAEQVTSNGMDCHVKL